MNHRDLTKDNRYELITVTCSQTMTVNYSLWIVHRHNDYGLITVY